MFGENGDNCNFSRMIWLWKGYFPTATWPFGFQGGAYYVLSVHLSWRDACEEAAPEADVCRACVSDSPR